MFNEAFWVAVSFVIFAALVYKPAAKFIAKSLDEKIAGIKADLGEALRLKRDAEALLASYTQKNKMAEQEAGEIIENAREEAKSIIEEARKELEYTIIKRTELANRKILEAETAALKSIKDNAIDIAIGAAKSLIMENLSKEASEEIMLNAIGDLDRKFH